MRKILFFLTLNLLSLFMITAEQQVNHKKDHEGIPQSLKDKRVEEEQFIKAFIEQMCGDPEALSKVRRELIEEAEKNVYSKKVDLCYAPGLISFATWLTRLFRWDSSSASKLEVEMKKLDEWESKKRQEIIAISMQYEKFIPEAQRITKEASEKVNKTYKDILGNFREIGRKTEQGIKLLHEPNPKYLIKQPDIIQEKIHPRFAKQFHNNEVPITQEELARIFAANLVYMQRKAELEEILKAYNMLVDQYEKQQKV